MIDVVSVIRKRFHIHRNSKYIRTYDMSYINDAYEDYRCRCIIFEEYLLKRIRCGSLLNSEDDYARDIKRK